MTLGSINMQIRAYEANLFSDFVILSYNDVITIYIGHMSSDLRSGYQTWFVCWISTHNLNYRLRYCNFTQKMCNFSTIVQNKNSDKNRTKRNFFCSGKLMHLSVVFTRARRAGRPREIEKMRIYPVKFPSQGWKTVLKFPAKGATDCVQFLIIKSFLTAK